MIGNILDNTTFGEIFSSGGATLYKNPSDQTVGIVLTKNTFEFFLKKTFDLGNEN